ncbi:DNA-directed RNA polymerase subunit [Quillaja saponaria]|uniref:DNA-directed RNA polymerase n=1 Tax=Quillaja saponaria TaxID=32244 RepID=A0AAD7QIX2_QUISA|nr:DNA-directed RNA polymerase subunit [Quillaja saponaria]
MEENPSTTVLDGEIVGIRFALATHQEICTASISDSAISHASQLSNPFLGLPLEFGRCESCGTSEPGKCEGHFGYIKLPVPIYHPSHFPNKSNGLAQRLLSSCCEGGSQVSIREVKTTDGARSLELKLPSRSRLRDGFWNFLEKYGFRYGDNFTRTLLPCEVMEIIKRLPDETRKKLAGKGYFPQDGYIVEYVPVPPNCLSVPEVSDGISVMSSDPSITMLKKVLKKVETIKGSRSGVPNFESHEVEAADLQSAIDQYLQVRGTGKVSRGIETHFGVSKELNDSSTKAWLEKMRTLFIRKGSGFSSRSVITGDAYKRVNEIGIPLEVAQRITFEEKVNAHNISYLQELVDKNCCLTYREGLSTYSLREGSKGHTYLRPGQIVHRRIMDGDIVFVNRPPTTHKHSLQALAVYIHDDHTVKINPLICGPLSADFDGDCVHLFYPQSLAAKAEVLELFSVEKQLLSSHSGNLNLQLATDSLLSFKSLFKMYFLDRVAAQQLSMFLSPYLPQPAFLKAHSTGPCWTALQMLQSSLPSCFDCTGDQYLAKKSEILQFDFNRDAVPTVINEIATSIFFEKGPEEVLKFFDVLQPFLMENIFAEGFSVSLKDFSISDEERRNIGKSIAMISPLLYHLRTLYNELVAQQLEDHVRVLKLPVTNFILKSSSLGDLVDSRSDSAINKIVQQIGFLGLQLSDKGKFYSKSLIEDVASLFHSKYSSYGDDYPSAEYGLLKGCFFHGLDPYEEMVHSISTREVIVRSSRGLSEPGTLFKNLMAILRDVVICYDGTVRNVCSNSIIQFEYGIVTGNRTQNLFPAGEPVGVLAATAMSNPAYKAVLDATPSSNSSWELMKEILLCKVSFKNEAIDRRVILYLNDCCCGKKYCQENAAYSVKNQLRKVSLKDTATQFLIEYKTERTVSESDAGLVGHIHLNEMLLKEFNVSMADVVIKCQETLKSFHKKKKVGHVFRRTVLFFSECCSYQQSCVPCLMFFWKDGSDITLERISNILSDMIFPVLLETIIKGDPRISSASIIWINPDTTTWIRNPYRSPKGELALDVILEKAAVNQNGDAWRIVIDSCLPVLHLIDTRRSIPYAIKQIQELLGVSCAFDQAVQRLSTSVTMVAKGVLKEHLILLANSMTCAGNLVGFNTGGYKALSRSLNVQVPFTEATLFTPRKCFERAAEKCHMDSLSSIVGSCSWGKHVAVGTGSKFELLWDTKEVGLNQDSGTDVYTFLHMVKSTVGEEESNTACLGMEIDDLVLEEDWAMSPEHSSGFDRPVFEDNIELMNSPETNPGESTWEKVSSLSNNSSKSEWTADRSMEDNTTKDTVWSSWSTDKTRKDVLPAMSEKDSSRSNGWDALATPRGEVEDADKNNYARNKLEKSNAWSSWATDKTKTQDMWSNSAPKDCSRSDKWNAATEKALSVQKDQAITPEAAQENSGKENIWSRWDVNKGESENSSISGGWNAATENAWSVQNDQAVTPDASQENYGKKNIWSVNKGESENSSRSGGWNAATAATENVWPVQKNQNVTADVVAGQKAGMKNVSSGWDINRGESENSSRSNSWNNWVKNADDAGGSGFSMPDAVQEASDWDEKVSKKTEIQSTTGWGSSVAGDLTTDEHPSHTINSSWRKQRYQENQGGWDSQNGGCNSESEKGHSWGWNGRESSKKNHSEGARGWGSNAGERKFKNNPASGVANQDSSMSGIYTATRQRLDVFTSEEQDILTAIEPVMQSIRRIMHQSGYNDGDPLAAEDQSFVLENVFKYHPDKATKMGPGIDHVMVSRHSSFLESRCFYIVLTDGWKEDFSYRKCLDNFIREKYPDIAETFTAKYFRKPRAGGNRERNPTPEETKS